MTYLHKEKQEAQHNGGFHFFPYHNYAVTTCLKHKACAKNITDRATQSNCAPLD